MITAIMRIIVFIQIIAMIKYSNGGDTTNFQIRYLSESLLSGMNRDTGLALSAKSIHCFYKRQALAQLN